MANTFNLTVVTPEDVIFEGEITKLIAPGVRQEIAILPDHTPLYAQILKGSLELFFLNQPTQSLPVDGGVLRVKRNQASIIVGFS